PPLHSLERRPTGTTAVLRRQRRGAEQADQLGLERPAKWARGSGSAFVPGRPPLAPRFGLTHPASGAAPRPIATTAAAPSGPNRSPLSAPAPRARSRTAA